MTLLRLARHPIEGFIFISSSALADNMFQQPSFERLSAPSTP
jgi:hypothetical protein